MTGQLPMQGVRVLEVAAYGFVPGAAAVLADWGADVVKVEHPLRGDPLRGLSPSGIAPGTNGFTFLWEIFNRGKRSVGIDLSTERGRELLLGLTADADVFLTSFLPAARRKLGIDVDDIRAVNPRIVYARGSGVGSEGPEADRGSFDSLAYWFRTGLGHAVTRPDAAEVVGLPSPAFGDIQASMNLAGGVSAALFHRERTGESVIVDSSLLSAGMWAMQGSLAGANLIGAEEMPRFDRQSAPNPLSNTYRTADGRYIALTMLSSDRFWPRLCELLGRPDLIHDPRFASIHDRARNARACIAELDATFATRDLEYWAKVLARQEGHWAIVRTVTELNDDEQAWANGYLSSVDHGGGRSITLVAAPAQFDGSKPDLSPAPELGSATDEVLRRLGLGWDELLDLKESGVIT